MGNKEIARQFNLLASLMELHGENAFKTKAYANAYLSLRKWDKPLDEMSDDEINAIPGIGSSVISKIHELNTTGKMDVLESWKAKTPEGIQQLLGIKGLGPKKVKQIWDELKVESPAELLYACNENRLVKVPGFGLKTQEDLKQKITYYLESEDQLLFGNCEEELNLFLEKWKHALPGHRMDWVGEFATKCPVITQLELLVSPFSSIGEISNLDSVTGAEAFSDDTLKIEVAERFDIRVHFASTEKYNSKWAELTMQNSLWGSLDRKTPFQATESVEQWLIRANVAGLPVELMDKDGIETASVHYWADLVEENDICGIIHNHSTWSDGINTLEEMAVSVKERGYEYFAICDHSRSAFYANGLSAGRVLEQMDEIDALNKKLAPFKVFKGIESDILGDGALDYEPEILSRFDLIVASIHSNLRMDEGKAMSRLITAIENPYTRILGHPTGRLLLARKGYPIDHRKVIDACAANGVAIELNANPLRLDVDYRWLDYCMEKEVWVSINPDAHSRGQVAYVKYGVFAARKGGLKKHSCLNALSLPEFENWLKRR